VKDSLVSSGVELVSAGLSTEPSSSVEVTGSDASALLRMLDAIEEQDDVSEVHSNFDIPEDVLQELAAGN